MALEVAGKQLNKDTDATLQMHTDASGTHAEDRSEAGADESDRDTDLGLVIPILLRRNVVDTLAA